MSDHNFSNQKSALEDYFISLLGDELSDAPVSVKNEQKETIESKAGHSIVDDQKDKVLEIDPVEGTSNSQTEIPKTTMRTSMADMLADVEKIVVSEPKIVKDFAEPVAEIIIPMPEVSPQPEVKTEIEIAVEAEPEPVEVVIADVQPDVAQIHEPVKEMTGPPEWAESSFQCLLFKVGGLTLAVPLVKLNGVIPWSEKVVETPNQTDWYLGVLMNHGNKVEVIDTAVMVLPAEHRKDMAAEPADRLSHILLVDDQRWGLACDAIGEVIWLKKDDVKWRSNKTKRPWLLGTVIDHMCAVMDTEAFADMLGHKK